MPLSRELENTIEDFVREKPRNIQEIANKIDKSWKTADRYVKEMKGSKGTIEVRKFREGSRGALKVVYWNGRSRIFSSSFKEHLFNKIENGGNFSPFDIYQSSDEELREAFVEKQDAESPEIKHDVEKLFREAEEEIKVFSRNLSWANLEQDGKEITDIFKELAEKGVDIRFLARVDVSSRKNAETLLKINKEVGREAISIKHSIQPIRGFIVDKEFARLSEAKELEEEYVSHKEEGKTTYVFYNIRDKDWVKWLDNCFWSLSKNALNGRDRLEDLKSIKNLSELE